MFIGVAVGVIIIVMISVACCVNNNTKIRIILYMKCRWSFGNRLEVGTFLYIVYEVLLVL